MLCQVQMGETPGSSLWPRRAQPWETDNLRGDIESDMPFEGRTWYAVVASQGAALGRGWRSGGGGCGSNS